MFSSFLSSDLLPSAIIACQLDVQADKLSCEFPSGVRGNRRLYGLNFRSHNVLFTHEILHVFLRLPVRFATRSRVPLVKREAFFSLKSF